VRSTEEGKPVVPLAQALDAYLREVAITS